MNDTRWPRWIQDRAKAVRDELADLVDRNGRVDAEAFEKTSLPRIRSVLDALAAAADRKVREGDPEAVEIGLLAAEVVRKARKVERALWRLRVLGGPPAPGPVADGRR